ncbi:glycosyltransferase family 4 protein [Algoriphagus aestuarii]|nr:glycosyltransferase family 4 protein [Algoriphagus aestuarii]
MKKSRNVLFLQSSSELYGSGKIIHQVLRIYREEGFYPVVVLTGNGPLADLLKEDGFEIRIQNLGILRRKYVNVKGLINRFNKKLKAYRFLDKLQEEFQFELVYSNTLAVIVGSYWARKNQLPHIWHIHEILSGPKPLVKLLRSMLDNGTPEPIVVSEAVKKHWESTLQVSNPEVIHNGIPYQQFLNVDPEAKNKLGLPVDKLTVTMIGRINPGKGQLFFLEMARAILKTYPQCHFVLVGDPFPGYESIHEEIKSVIQDDELLGNVVDLGFRTDIETILAATDIFVLPSILPDSFPTVILEAMASGLPVIATRSGGAEEMVTDGETGFLIPIGNVAAGKAAMEQLIQRDDLRKKMGQAGREKVLREYSFEQFSKKIKNHLWRQIKES